MEPGVFRIETNPNNGFDFIYNKEDITIIAQGGFQIDSLRVAESEENKIFIDYLRTKNEFMTKLSLLEPLMLYYPRNDSFYFDIEAKYLVTDVQYKSYLDSINKVTEGMVVHTIIQWGQLPDIDIAQLNEPMRKYYRDHYFDPVSASDSVVINTPILPGRVIDYLSLYVTPGSSREAQEAAFISAVDGLMAWSAKDKPVRDAVVNFLIDGFQMYGFETVLTHLVENYVLDNSCVSDQEEDKLRKRIEGFRLLAVGNTAPDIVMENQQGNPYQLSSSEGKLKLVVFWASWCPHCMELMPALNILMEQYTEGQVDVITVSIDEDRDAWLKALKEKDLSYENLCDLKGWDSPAVSDYYVYATPTLLLLDENLTIIAKPSGIPELMDAINTNLK
jgi:thiol-disulfide isomerase/thioredoxin